MSWQFLRRLSFRKLNQTLLLGAIAGGLVAGLSALELLKPIEARSIDRLMRLRGEQPWNSEIVVVGIDDRTLATLGRFPIERRYYTQMLEKLRENNINVVALDILMPEPSPDDVSLAEAMADHGGVVLAEASGQYGRQLLPNPTLEEYAIGLGHIDQSSDFDGFTRYHNTYVGDRRSLAAAAAAAYSLTTDLITIPPFTERQLRINWPGPVETVPYVSLIDLINGRQTRVLSNRTIAVVGATGVGLDQQLRTPFNNNSVGGLYVYVAVLDNLLAESWLRPAFSPPWLLTALVLAGPLIAGGLRGRSFLQQISLWIIGIAGWLLICLLALANYYVLPVVAPILLLSLIEGVMIFTDRLRSSALLQARNEMLGTMSHELRTPLIAIIGLSELLQKTRLSQRQQEFSNTIYDSSQALLALINDLLDFSKIESEKLVLEQRPTSLREVIEESLAIVAPKTINKPVELVYQIDPAVPEQVMTDSNRLRQILLNLLSNAVKFTEAGTVSVSLMPIAVSQQSSEIGLRFAVQDSGIGIAPERLKTIFEPFRQASTATARQYGGTGLGLTISRRLATAMGGALWAASQVGAGSTFFFTIQTSAAPPDTATAKQEVKEVTANLCVLLIDEHPIRRTSLLWQLQALNIQAITGRLTASGLEPAPTQPVDITIVDEGQIATPESATALVQAAQLSRSSLVILAKLGETAPPPHWPKEATILRKPLRQSALHQALMQPVAGTQATPQTPDASTRLRVLVADDNPVNQRVAQHMLQRLGHDVQTISTGREALATLQQQTFDVVLMDMRMPEIDGLEAARRVRQQRSSHQPWIIAMTANASAADRRACLRAGMNDYLSKPMSLAALSQALGRAEPDRVLASSGE